MSNSAYSDINFGYLTGWKNYKLYRWMVHLFIWIVYTLAFAAIYAFFYESVSLSRSIPQYLMTAWIDAVAAYFTVYFLIPKYLLKRRFSGFVLCFFISAAVLSLSQRAVLGYLTYPLIYPEYTEVFRFFRFNPLLTFFNIYVMTFIFASVKMFEYWYYNQMQNKELQKQKMESELKFLKSQIHPHFLFNTLNNLYALTLDRSEKAPEVVVKLSDLLSYMLYECNADYVALDKEVQLLKDYLDLEKIRYHNELNCDFATTGDVGSKFIPPLLLLPFVENAFKHGLSKKAESPWIRIRLNVDEEFLNFMVENNKPTKEQVDEARYTEGIGLQNVRRRLELIYGENYALEVRSKKELFGIYLKIELNKMQKF